MNQHSTLVALFAAYMVLGVTSASETTLLMFKPTTADAALETTMVETTTTPATTTSTTTSTVTTTSTATTTSTMTTTTTTTTTTTPTTSTTTTTTTTTRSSSRITTDDNSATTSAATTPLIDTTTSTTTSTMTTTTTTTPTTTRSSSRITTDDNSATVSSTKQPVIAATIVFTADFSAELSQVQLDATTGHFCGAMANSLEADVTELICTGILVSDDIPRGRRLRGNVYSANRRHAGEIFEYDFTAEVPPTIVASVGAAEDGTSNVEEKLAASTTKALATFEQALSTDDSIPQVMSTLSAEVKTHTVSAVEPTEREHESLQTAVIPAGSVAGIVVATLFVLGGAVAAVVAVIVMRRKQNDPVTPTELPSIDTKKSSHLAKAYASADKHSASPKGMEMRSVATISTPLHQSDSRRHSSSHSIFVEALDHTGSSNSRVGPN